MALAVQVAVVQQQQVLWLEQLTLVQVAVVKVVVVHQLMVLLAVQVLLFFVC
jgi:hypothetical protein